MRVRRFGLRLLAAALAILWTLAGGLVLLAYRPGGPVDLLVGGAACLPLAVALVGLLWPPVTRSDRGFAAVTWLGIVAGLLLVPSIGGVLNQILARGTQTLLPSPEAVYPWVVALAATALFSGFGLARRITGATAVRRRRLVIGIAFAALSTLAIGGVFAGVATANELALRDRPAVASRFGPTAPDLRPPGCSAALRTGGSAVLSLDLSGSVDGRSIGGALLQGQRNGTDVRWTAQVATDRVLGRFGVVRIGERAWTAQPGRDWTAVPVSSVSGDLVDVPALAIALSPGNRVTAEDRGQEFVDGARARHCRVAIDGPTFLAAFPEASWLVGGEKLTRWRGEIDYWVFGDGELGLVSGSVSGEPGAIMPGAIQATVQVRLTATDRDRPVSIVPPVP